MGGWRSIRMPRSSRRRSPIPAGSAWCSTGTRPCSSASSCDASASMKRIRCSARSSASRSRSVRRTTARSPMPDRGCTASPRTCWRVTVAAKRAGSTRRRASSPARLPTATLPTRSWRISTLRRLWPKIADAVAELPEEERDALLLFVWEELSYEEIAVALGVPVGTVRSRLNRARVRLRELGASIGRET